MEFIKNIFSANRFQVKTMSFHKRLGQILSKRNINQLQFSQKTGISTATLSNIINGNNNPTLKKIEKIIEALNYEDAQYLIFGTIKNTESNILNEDLLLYGISETDRIKKELEDLKKRVDELEKWKGKVIEK